MQWLGLAVTLILTVPIALESARDVWQTHRDAALDGSPKPFRPDPSLTAH